MPSLQRMSSNGQNRPGHTQTQFHSNQKSGIRSITERIEAEYIALPLKINKKTLTTILPSFLGSVPIKDEEVSEEGA